MATCFPDYGADESAFKSKAELAFHNACRDQLDKSYQLFHSVAWISKRTGLAKDGEADFLLCHPHRGFLVIEVKGGGVRADIKTGKWTSVDRNGAAHEIANPFLQASTSKHTILEKLKEHPSWPKLGLRRVTAGHAAFFSDLDNANQLKGPEAPTEIIGGRGDLAKIDSWVDGVFKYWSTVSENANSQALGNPGVELMRRIFARVVDVMPLMVRKLEEEEAKRLQLTQQQAHVLDYISRQHRVAISGGAGTGKTVLAVEKARRLASEGFRTLLTCYNVPLAESLKQICANDKNLDVISFHRLCKQLIDKANALSKRDLLSEARASYPGKDTWDHYHPIALTYALEILEDRYDAVVVDEGQDFGEEFWLPIEMILKDSQVSLLYIFYDENQNVYTRASTFPTDLSPVMLNINCRNTKQIHGAAYQYYEGKDIQAPSIVGSEIQILDAPDITKQAKKIYDLISSLISKEKIPPSSISVLIADKLRRREYEKILHSFTLPATARWGDVDDQRQENEVVIETVARFKGLESDILILWGLDRLPPQERRETLYVGLSRAKSLLYICGINQICQSVLPSSASQDSKKSLEIIKQ